MLSIELNQFWNFIFSWYEAWYHPRWWGFRQWNLIPQPPTSLSWQFYKSNAYLTRALPSTKQKDRNRNPLPKFTKWVADQEIKRFLAVVDSVFWFPDGIILPILDKRIYSHTSLRPNRKPGHKVVVDFFSKTISQQNHRKTFGTHSCKVCLSFEKWRTTINYEKVLSFKRFELQTIQWIFSLAKFKSLCCNRDIMKLVLKQLLIFVS